MPRFDEIRRRLSPPPARAEVKAIECGGWGSSWPSVRPHVPLSGGVDYARLAGPLRENSTVSIGLALMQAGIAGLEELLERADRALYAAKAAGRDRLVVDGE